MPHAGDDLASADEVKVYKDEGDEEQRSSENLSEDKIGLVTETEEVRTPVLLLLLLLMLFILVTFYSCCSVMLFGEGPV